MPLGSVCTLGCTDDSGTWSCASTLRANAGSTVCAVGGTLLFSPSRPPKAEPAAAFGVAMATVAVALS